MCFRMTCFRLQMICFSIWSSVRQPVKMTKKRSIRVKTSLHIESLWSHLCTSDVSCPLLLFLTGLTEHEIISQVTMFVFAGYETSAIALVFFSVQFGTKSWNHETPSKWNRLHFPKQGRIKVSDYGVVFLILFDENIKSELSLTKIVICNNLIGSSWVWSSDADGVPGQCGQWVSEVMSFYLCLLKEYTLWDRVVTKRERRSVPQPIGPELQAV